MKNLPLYKTFNIIELIIFIPYAIFDKISYLSKYYKRLKGRRTFFNSINDFGFQIDNTKKDLILFKPNVEIILRKKGSDYQVFNQIFIQNEYKIIIDFFLVNNIYPKTIIDAGSNIGLTSLKLLMSFPKTKIICIEPDPENFIKLRRNLLFFKDRVYLIERALWYKEEELELDFEFRDGKEWSRRVTLKKSFSEFNIKGISLNILIESYKLSSIDFLKIDIEGSEANIFKESNDLTFLDIVKVIAIEIHDEFNCREEIYKILKLKKFVLLNSGELTIGIKPK